MQASTEGARLRVKHKTFMFQGQVEWTGNREGVARIAGRPDIAVASPPEFKGPDGKWAPEHLFVTSVNLCTMLTFLSFAQHKNLPVRSYRSEAAGTLEFVDGSYRFTKIVLRPHIAVADSAFVQSVKETMEDAHRSCLISNSMRSEVVVDPVVEVARSG